MAEQNTQTFGTSEADEGSTIGPYHLLQMVGQGGMGEVWVAEQKHPVRRRVAVKLIKAGMDTREVIARFESERQALALMDHPHIAKVFDAGATPQGRSYFVMEYVTGVPITEYCDKHKLDVRHRLDLFVSVCEGVQHAHHKAIIHRDLKPSNILVTEIDGKPVPKIIDFGVAKATARSLSASTMYTQLGAIVGTPGYMSPEQADSAGVDVDTRTDVYSLGVVLYELLAGTLPIDFTTTPIDQFPRRLREEEAPRPSTRLSNAPRMNVPTLAGEVRGDLDAICLKALEKDRARRYAAPNDLAADIERYLRNEPILARPASARYRARKYIQRHRVGVLLTGIAAVLMLVVAVAQTFELRRTIIERDRANRERDRANRVADFMSGMFKVSNPSESRGNDIRAREILDKASKDIGEGLAKDPDLQAQMMQVMGSVYRSLGLYAKADSLLSHAVAIGRSRLGANNPATLRSMHELAQVRSAESRYSEAEKLEKEVVSARRTVLGPRDRDTLESMSRLGAILNSEGRYPEAEKQHREVTGMAQAAFGPEDPLTLSAMDLLATDLDYQGKYAESEKMFRQVLELERRAKGPDNPDVLNEMNDVAASLQRQSRAREAEALYLEILEAERRVLGPEHPDTLMVMGNLGGVLVQQKRLPEAEKLFRETLELKIRKLGPENRSTLVTADDLAGALEEEGRFADAEQLVRKTLAIERRVLGPEHNDTLYTMVTLGDVLKSEKHYSEAEKVYREAFEGQRRAIGEIHPRTAYTVYQLGCALALDNKKDQAFASLQYALEHGLSANTRANVQKDDDLKSLHEDPRFKALLARPPGNK